MTRLLPKGLSSLLSIPPVVWIQPRQFERTTMENEREWKRERERAFTADRFRVAWPAARYQTSGTRNGQSGRTLSSFHPRRRPPRRRSNFAVKFERMPCKSRNRGQFRGNVNKYRCTLVSRATVPGYGLVVSLLAQSPYSVLPPPLSLPPLPILVGALIPLAAGN